MWLQKPLELDIRCLQLVAITEHISDYNDWSATSSHSSTTIVMCQHTELVLHLFVALMVLHTLIPKAVVLITYIRKRMVAPC